MVDKLRLMTSDKVPPPRGFWLQCQVAWIDTAISFGVLLVVTVGLALQPFLYAMPGWFFVGCVAGAVAAGIYAGRFRRRLRDARLASNWTLRADDRGLFVKFRSHRAHDLGGDAPDVVFVPRGIVAGLRHGNTERRSFAPDQTERYTARSYLEVLFVDGVDLEPLRRQLEVEDELLASSRHRRDPARHYPMTLSPGGTLRLGWYGGVAHVTPPLGKALALLARWYPVADAVVADGRAEQEARILALAEGGRVVPAVRLARKLYGLSVKDAKAFVDELRGR